MAADWDTGAMADVTCSCAPGAGAGIGVLGAATDETDGEWLMLPGFTTGGSGTFSPTFLEVELTAGCCSDEKGSVVLRNSRSAVADDASGPACTGDCSTGSASHALLQMAERPGKPDPRSRPDKGPAGVSDKIGPVTMGASGGREPVEPLRSVGDGAEAHLALAQTKVPRPRDEEYQRGWWCLVAGQARRWA